MRTFRIQEEKVQDKKSKCILYTVMHIPYVRQQFCDFDFSVHSSITSVLTKLLMK